MYNDTYLNVANDILRTLRTNLDGKAYHTKWFAGDDYGSRFLWDSNNLIYVKAKRDWGCDGEDLKDWNFQIQFNKNVVLDCRGDEWDILVGALSVYLRWMGDLYSENDLEAIFNEIKHFACMGICDVLGDI